MEQTQWHREWAALDRKRRARLRRTALFGAVAEDPDEAALVAGFARDARRRERIQLVAHALVLASIALSLALKLAKGGGALAAIFTGLLVVELASLAFFLWTRRRLAEAEMLNEEVS